VVTQVAAPGPRTRSVAKFTAYPSDRVDTDRPSGSLNLIALAPIDSSSSEPSRSGCSRDPRQNDARRSVPPATITAAIKARAAGGWR
jgi:hypothetical protein